MSEPVDAFTRVIQAEETDWICDDGCRILSRQSNLGHHLSRRTPHTL
ncbi:hypothetical protein RB7434 [Rhodopirellula baltica SH 1]|uniref:Uncharacterized protein n=1 Tax=Rhodopirellula baltica (strain DSM 10527 / NCIMB 13988 / SH1) TaxID=243090 RepID=Q7UNQ9_RHOBA|nr:hypothetical protein RB7434 [Rhodopirellula baltica SH 1]